MAKFSKHSIDTAADRIIGAIRNGVTKKISFYGALVLLIRDSKFVQSSAEALVKLYEEIESDVTMGFTVQFFREAHEEYHDNNHDLDTIAVLTDRAFIDLAKHMRSPEVRRIFADLMEMSGIDENADLFVHTANVRLLTDNPEGSAVVTLVVHNYGVLQKLLDQQRGIETIHYSI